MGPVVAFPTNDSSALKGSTNGSLNRRFDQSFSKSRIFHFSLALQESNSRLRRMRTENNKTIRDATMKFQNVGGPLDGLDGKQGHTECSAR